MPTKLDYINELERRHGSSVEIDELTKRYTDQPDLYQRVPDPNATAADVFDRSVDLELPLTDVEQNYQSFVAAPEESKLRQLFDRYIKDPISAKTGFFQDDISFRRTGVPDGLRFDRLSELKTELPAAALHIVSERISGLSLSAFDILAQEFDRYVLDSDTPVTTLSGLVEKITKLEAKGKTRQAAEMTGALFKFMGGLKTARKIIGPAINRLPVRQALKYMFAGGVEFGTVTLAEEISQMITMGNEIEWEKIHKSAGWGTVFGGVQAVAGKIAQFKDVKEAKVFEPRLAKIPDKLLRRVVEAGQAKAEGMSRGAWMKVYGKDMEEFTRQLQVIAETPLLGAEPTVAPTTVAPTPEAAQRAPVAKPPVKAGIVPPKPTGAIEPVTTRPSVDLAKDDLFPAAVVGTPESEANKAFLQLKETVELQGKLGDVVDEALVKGEKVIRADLEKQLDGIFPPKPKPPVSAPVITTKPTEGPPPTVKQRNAGFATLPPVSVVDEIAAANPNIDVPFSQKDLGILQDSILTPVNQARNTKNQDIIEAAETMAITGMDMNNDIQAQLHGDQVAFKKLPKEFKADNGAKFFELMDKHFSPEEIDTAKDVPDEVKPILKHFKLQDEAARQEVIAQKRELNAKFNEKKTLTELQIMAKAEGIPVKKKGKPKKVGRRTVQQDINRTRAELAKDLAKTQVPDDWGKQWSHIQHIFFGQYQLFYEEVGEKGPIRHFIGRAETRAEAYEQLLTWKKARKTEGFKDFDTVKLSATPELNIPLDVLRLSRAQYGALRSQLERAAEINSEEISDALKGVIGLKSTKQKWWGALLKRRGKKGFSKDFWKVWQAQTTQFQRWKHLTQMNKEVEPLIEKVRAQGLTNWANFLEDTKDFVWGRKRTVASKALDQYLERLPVVGDYVKPFALERWANNIKAFQYWTKLQTGRFYVLNSLQPLQTLWPVVGTKGTFRGYQLYYSKEGQELLKRHKVFGVAGKLHETVAARGRKFERFLPAGASEIRNQGVAFLSLYDFARKRLQYSDASAAHYGQMRGQLFTQFAYTAADVPKAFRGPVGGTIFQFKRFQIKNLELFSRLIREGNYGGAARWVTALGMIGGAKALTFGLTIAGGGYLTFKIYKAIKEEYGEDVANTIAFGLPALIGIDMSGSVEPFDVPYGRTVPEKIGNTVLGPTGQQILKLVTNIASDDVAKDVGVARRALDTIAQTSPTIKQFQFFIKALERDTSTFDAKQRKQYELEVEDLWKKAFAFRPVKESQERLFLEAFFAVKNEYDEIADKIAVDLVELNELSQSSDGFSENYGKWSDKSKKITERIQKNLKNWQATYPEFPITSESILARVKNKTEARQFTQIEREWKRLAKNLRGAFIQEVKR